MNKPGPTVTAIAARPVTERLASAFALTRSITWELALLAVYGMLLLLTPIVIMALELRRVFPKSPAADSTRITQR